MVKKGKVFESKAIKKEWRNVNEDEREEEGWRKRGE